MDAFLTYFFTQGILGVIAIGEFLIIVALFRLNEAKSQKLLDQATESRNLLTEPLQKLQGASDKIVAKMEQSNDLLIKLLPTNTK